MATIQTNLDYVLKVLDLESLTLTEAAPEDDACPGLPNIIYEVEDVPAE